jgi:hypothetical protein
MNARPHDAESAATDAAALLEAAAARLTDSNLHREAAEASELGARLKAAHGTHQDGAEIVHARDRLASIAYTLDEEDIARTPYPHLRAASADLRHAVEELDRALGLSKSATDLEPAKLEAEVPAETVPTDPAALGSAVLLLAEAARAGIKVAIYGDHVEVATRAARLTASLAERLREQQPALLQVGRAVLAGRHGRHPPPGIADELVDDIPF